MLNNPNCTRDNRCGKCFRDIQSAHRQAKTDKRLAEQSTEDGKYVCITCQKPKMRADFLRLNHGLLTQFFNCTECHLKIRRQKWQTTDKFIRKGSTEKRYLCSNGCKNMTGHKGQMCRPCYLLTGGPRKGGLLAPNPKPPKTTVVLQQEPVTEPVVVVNMYDCLGECGTKLEQENSRCDECRKIHEVVQVTVKTYRSKIAKFTSLLESGKVDGLMFIGGMEIWTLHNRCKQIKIDPVTGEQKMCNKLIFDYTSCYECATGKPRTIPNRPRVVLASQPPDDISEPPVKLAA